MLRYYHIVASAGLPYFTSLLYRKVFKSNCRYINRLKRSIEERLRSIAPAPRRTHLTFLALPSLQPTLDSRRTILQLKFARSLFSFWIFFLFQLANVDAHNRIYVYTYTHKPRAHCISTDVQIRHRHRPLLRNSLISKSVSDVAVVVITL